MKGVGDKHSSTKRYKNVEEIIKSQKRKRKLKWGFLYFPFYGNRKKN